MNAKDGKFVWSFKTGGLIWSSGILTEYTLYVGSFDNYVYGFNKDDGEKVFEYKIGDYLWSNMAIYENTLIFSGYDGTLYCVE